ncbi:seven-hairpin glycosidase [Pholiota conissans]|uniref:alpha-1,2-Mannosidase n=1 Tax=Pholiota conissans TaxID=109636 RepID=A0A9P6CY99_9AGAR|nr:seven-hairpin glycosidase [Pholiota conissans]
MLRIHTFLFALGAFLSFPRLTLGELVQKQGLALPPQAEQLREEVKTIFTDSYGAYKKYAFGHDDVLPISQGFYDGRNGWGATIVDAMTTMNIMGLNDLFDEAVAFATNIDFSRSHTDSTISVFESTIRYMGALLSAYELSGGKFPDLVAKAQQLGDKLAFAWEGSNAIPYNNLNFTTNTPVKESSNIAQAGTLTLEWATLSKYTSNNTYLVLADKAFRSIVEGSTPLPGLPAQGVDPADSSPIGGYVTWGGGSDSYFEYLIKYPRLNSSFNSLYADSWITAVDSSIRTLLRKSIPGNYTYLADYDSHGRIRHIGSHLACFYGGNWILGGKMLNNETVVNLGLELSDACWNTYASTATGIGPETFDFMSSDGSYTGSDQKDIPEDQIAFNEKHGFYIDAPYYVLRPEVLESNFYAWRATGDTKYIDRAAAAVKSFQTYLKVTDSGGYAGLHDVDNSSSDRVDDTESFWFAEVLKYLYLTFDDPEHISLDKYVFNTEAHPFEAPATSEQTYSSGNTQPRSKKPFTPTTGKLPVVSPLPAVSNLPGSL